MKYIRIEYPTEKNKKKFFANNLLISLQTDFYTNSNQI